MTQGNDKPILINLSNSPHYDAILDLSEDWQSKLNVKVRGNKSCKSNVLNPSPTIFETKLLTISTSFVVLFSIR